LANTFDWFTSAGLDDWLENVASIPKPIQNDGSNGDWNAAKQTRLTWLTDTGIRAYLLDGRSLDEAIELFGLPQSRPEDRGAFVIQRFQRVALQRWTRDITGMPSRGSVVRVLAGDLLK